jgi:nucleoside-diphosphate-sugar epimerase
MNVLVTGANGFIGARVAAALLDRGSDQVAFCGRQDLKDHEFIKRGAKYLRGDLADAAFAREAVRGIDAIVHCAGLAGTWGPYEDYHRANVLVTRHLLEAAKEAGARRFVNISSPSIYFDFKDQLNLREVDLPPKFSNHYARTKWEAEVLVREAHGPKLATVSLRPRSVIGAGDRNVLPRLLRLQETGSLVEVGSGENIVDITTVGNLLDAIFLCMRAPESALGETYNISNGKPMKFWSFVDLVLKSAGLPTERKRLPLFPVMMAARANELIHRAIRAKKEPALLQISVGIIAYSMTMDISKARTKLGYDPRLSTEEGVAEFIAWNSGRPRG